MNILPISILNEYSQLISSLAQNIAVCAKDTQNNIYVFHGNNSEYKNKENLTNCLNFMDLSIHEYYIPDNCSISLDLFKNNDSIILSGLVKNTLYINNKINHLLIRYSNNVQLQIAITPISGVDIIKSSHIAIGTAINNSINIEFSQNITMECENSLSSFVHIVSSTDVSFNSLYLPVHPFTNSIFTQSGEHNMLSTSPNLSIID